MGNPGNLPLQLTSFVGREREMAEVKHLLSTKRLLTLTGAGGCGKTRLALEVASDLLEDFADGVWLIELAALANPALLPQAVAGVFGIRESALVPLSDILIEYLQGKELLILLDNCEHLIQACASLVDRLLHACPNLRILTTSREALRVPGETSFRIPSLTLPDRLRLPSSDDLLRFEAIRLFVDRAAAGTPDFQLSDTNATFVAQICERLDGMPLAIELAASRVRNLTVQQIAARLDDRFRLLSTGPRTVLPRQQTLRAAVDWSYDLLSPEEQILFSRLSVFAGGWTPHAAEEVCADGILEKAEIPEMATHLMDKSLVVMQDRSGEPHYSMLETVRLYAQEKLGDSDEYRSARSRHLGFFLKLAEEARLGLKSGEQITWLARLESELDNLRAAMEWSLESNERERGLRLVSAFAEFCFQRGYLNEGREWLGRLLANNSNVLSLPVADALYQAAILACSQKDMLQAIGCSEQSLSLYRQLNHKQGIAKALASLGHALDLDGNAGKATRHLEESLAFYRETDDKWGMGTTLLWLADSRMRQGDLQRAAMLTEQSLALFRELGDRWGIAYSLGTAGEISRRQGDYVQAAARFAESITLHRLIGNRADIPFSLEALAIVVSLQGKPASAASLWGAGEGIRRTINSPLPSTYSVDYAPFIGQARARLGTGDFDVAWEEGRNMTLEQAIEFALVVVKDTSTESPNKNHSKGEYGGLTERERQIAALIAQGKSNREIAQDLVIVIKTVEVHITHILGKLGFSTRAQIAGWAISKGLAPPPRDMGERMR